MNWCLREATLKELLSDPIVAAVMRADGVDPYEFEAMLRQIGRNANEGRNAGERAQME